MWQHGVVGKCMARREKPPEGPRGVQGGLRPLQLLRWVLTSMLDASGLAVKCPSCNVLQLLLLCGDVQSVMMSPCGHCPCVTGCVLQ
jgi:hypothetical protein